YMRRQIAQVKIARADLDPGVRHANERLLQIRVRKPNRSEHCSGGRPAGTVRERIWTHRHDTTSKGSGSRLSRVFQLAYDPSVRSVGANSARFASARAHGNSSRAAARSA